MSIKNFKDFGIKTETKTFVGEKIKMPKVLNKEIIVHDSKMEASKLKDVEKCLYLQIEIDGVKRVIFTSSKYLIQAIEKMTSENFPFKTTIIESDERYEFT